MDSLLYRSPVPQELHGAGSGRAGTAGTARFPLAVQSSGTVQGRGRRDLTQVKDRSGARRAWLAFEAEAEFSLTPPGSRTGPVAARSRTCGSGAVLAAAHPSRPWTATSPASAPGRDGVAVTAQGGTPGCLAPRGAPTAT